MRSALISAISSGGSSIPSFTSNVDLWVEADSGVLNGSGTAATDGQTVATWTDKQGNYNVANAADATRPTFVAASKYNNKPAVFLGPNQFLKNVDFINGRTGAGWVIAARSMTQYAYGGLVSGTQAGQYVAIGGSGAGNGWSIGNYTVGINSVGRHSSGGCLISLKLDTTQGTSATRWVFRQNKVQKTITFTGDSLAAAMPGLGTGLSIGTFPDQAGWGDYEVFGMIHFSETPTDGDIAAAEAYFENKYFADAKQRINIVCEGDSITKGYAPALIPNEHLSYPYLLGDHFGGANHWNTEGNLTDAFDHAKTVWVRNVAEVADTIVNINDTPAGSQQMDGRLDEWALRDICILWIGTNDLYFATSAATVLAEIQEYVTARKTNYPGKEVWVGTILPRNDAGTPGTHETSRATVNAGLSSLTGIAGVIDFASTPEFADPSHFGDGVHLSAPDYVLVAQKAYDTLTA